MFEPLKQLDHASPRWTSVPLSSTGPRPETEVQGVAWTTAKFATGYVHLYVLYLVYIVLTNV